MNSEQPTEGVQSRGAKDHVPYFITLSTPNSKLKDAACLILTAAQRLRVSSLKLGPVTE